MIKTQTENTPGNDITTDLVLTNDTSRFPVSCAPSNSDAGNRENGTRHTPRFPDSYHTAHVVSSGGTGNEKYRDAHVHLPNTIEDVDRVNLPLTENPTKWNDETATILANVLHWQGGYVAEWIMRRAIDYATAHGYPPGSCYFQAALDWELWRRRAYIPELDHRNPKPNRQTAAKQYFYQLATLENT